MLGIIKIIKNEYRKENLAIVDYRLTFLGVPVYTVKFTSTNRDIVGKLGTEENKTLHICGFTNSEKK